MKKITCLIIDDEPPAIALLEKYTSMVEQLQVVGISQSAVKAFDMLKDRQVDLLFLDIQMPVLNGLDFIKTLKNPPAIILTTAYREYALDSYDLDIVDYLLKPIAFDRFLKSVDRYRNRIGSGGTEKRTEEVQPDHLFFNVNRTYHKVILNDILYVESLKDYVRIHMLDGRLVVKGNLGTIMKQLPGSEFVRIHRSFAIATKAITSYNQSNVKINDVELPIGLSYRDQFLKQFNS
ncbi:MAG: LytR/AlgR family response regulator transcription factor [Saprospiraceae bacterium]